MHSLTVVWLRYALVLAALRHLPAKRYAPAHKQVGGSVGVTAAVFLPCSTVHGSTEHIDMCLALSAGNDARMHPFRDSVLPHPKTLTVCLRFACLRVLLMSGAH